MTEVRGAWTEAEAEEFLQEVAVPIRLGTHRPDDSLWMVALWYRYRDGTFECATGANADIARFLRDDPEVTFDISTNEPPYRGVRGNGTASVSPDEDKAVLRSLIERYLETTESPLAEQLLSGQRAEVRIRIDPDELYSWDFSNRMRSTVD
jgi:nitroimidazol reductase NimA-like FMN-containing flavoprotein (pyridoxamine 5'-phosphate oxidase superfamily)